MNEHFGSSETELNRSQFFRLFALGCFDSFITLPISFMALVTNIVGSGPLFNFYQGWSLIHSNWGPVFSPKSVWATLKWSIFSVYWDEWFNPFYALVFFALFGLTPEAREWYYKAFRCVSRPFGVQREESVKDLRGMFEHGGVTNASATSNVSSRYGLRILTARIHFLIKSKCSTQADVLP